jgi:hypothetical protein
MGDVYRVSIVRETGSGEDYETETLFEVAGGIGMVVRIAPGALVDALRAANEDVPPSELAERVMDAAREAGAPVAPASHPFQGEHPKRKRRSKAEIAADEAAKALGFRDAAHQAEVDAARVDAVQAAAVPVSSVEQVSPETPSSPVVPPAVPQASPATPPGEAAPYNPFEVK